MKNFLLLATCVLLLQQVYSQAPLDPSFGNGGYVSVLENFKNSYSEKATQVLQQPDGKLLVFMEGGTIARHNTDGSLDLSWGVRGFQAMEGGPGAFLPDGKIIIAGVNTLQRLQANGKSDSSFGNAGKIAYPTTFFSNAYAVAVQPDGKIVVAGGYEPTSSSRQFSMLRYNPNGTLDAGFGNGGQVTTPTTYQYAQGRYVAVKSDGKVVVAGEAFNASSGGVNYLLAQYNANGTPDNSFGGTGIVQTGITGGSYGEAALSVQSDGKIWIGGSTFIARYGAAGSVEATFYTGLTHLRSIILQPDGKIVVGGDLFYGTNRYTGESDYSFVILRILSNSNPDNTFNGTGRVVIDFSNYDYMTSMIIQPDGKLVAVGATRASQFYGFSDYVIMRVSTFGSLDNSFNGNGKLQGSFPAYASGLNTVAVQPDGKILAAGLGLIYRFNPDGSRDSLFSDDGKTSFNASARSITLQTDGKILYTGSYSGEALVRLKANGSPDSSFGSNGAVQTPELGYPSHSTAIFAQPDGKILAGFITYPDGSSTAVPVLQRYNTNGSLDNSFNGNGTAAFPFTGIINTITIQPDGKILAAGSSASGSGPYGFAIARYNPDGTPDNGFGAGGKASTDFGDYPAGATTIMLLPGGKLAVGGSGFTTSFNYESFFGIAYFNADGSPDNSTGNGGKFVSTFPLVYDVNAIVDDGKFLVAGNLASGVTSDVLIARLSANGLPDSSFGTAGKIIVNFGRADLHPALARFGKRLYLAETNSLTNYEQTDNSGILAAYLMPDSTTTPPPNPPQPPANGLTYRFYQGVWTSLPDFNNLTPVKTGTTNNVDIGIRPTGVNTNYAFVWEGYINLPAAGDYTFETLSDDGSRIYFNTLYSSIATPLVDHDGEHYAYAKKGTIHVDSAGRYPVTITYFQKELDAVMQLYWAGPGIPRQVVPDAAFTSSYQPPSTSGLQYRFYQGVWTTLPDFSKLTAVKTGSTPNVNINVRPAGVNTNYAFVWEGYINIPAAGDYTFETFSDDGSRFYFNSFYAPTATPLIDHDGEHYAYAKKQTIHIDAAGQYPVAITYFQKELDAAMQLYWTGPGIARQLIPDAAFSSTYQPPVANGLRYRFYQGIWTSLPNFNALTPVKTGTTPNVNINVRPAGVNTNYAFLWEGYINIKMPGDYTFETFSDDGSRIYFNSLYSPTATALVDHDGEHYAYSKKATVHIDAPGLYPIAVTYFQKELAATMQLYWSGPGITRQLVPDSAFIYYTAVSSATAAGWQPHALATDIVQQPGLKLYPNPFTNQLNVEINNPVLQSAISVELYDAAGKKVYSQTYKNQPLGRSNHKVAVPGTLYPASLYHVQVRVNGVVLGSMKLMKAGK